MPIVCRRNANLSWDLLSLQSEICDFSYVDVEERSDRQFPTYDYYSETKLHTESTEREAHNFGSSNPPSAESVILH